MGPDPLEWTGLTVAMLWLGGAIWFALTNRPDDPQQLRRVPLTACAFAGGIAAVFVVAGAVGGGLDFMLPYVIGGAVVLGLAAFLTALIVDFCAGSLGAARTPQWLASGVVIAILVTYCWITLLSDLFLGGHPNSWQAAASPTFFIPALVAAAAGLVWWSELPRPGDR